MAPDTSIPRSERLGLAIILGVLLLATANNFLTFALGSIGAAVALVAGPACAGVAVRARSRRRGSYEWPGLRPIDAAAAAVCATFLLAIAFRLFLWRSLETFGLLYADLPWHIGRASQQAFLSTPGYWPLSPIAFPGPLPFVSFAGDSLVSATFRYLPISIHAFTYSQVLFIWAAVLWTAVAFVADGGAWGALTLLTIAILAMPAFLFGIPLIGTIVYVFFHANPNSLIAWPVGLAFTLHLQRSLRRGTPPSKAFLLLAPPASIFLKANQAFAFGFLQLAGFALWWSTGRRLEVLKGGALTAVIWTATIVLSLAMGSWPPSAGVHPSLANFRHYALVALPGGQSPWDLFMRAVSYVVLVGAVGWVGARLDGTREWTRAAVIPVAVLTIALAYLALGWWAVVPNGLAEGEPMHVNFELIMWLITAAVVDAVDRARASAVFAVSASVLALAFVGATAWLINTQPDWKGGVPLEYRYDTQVEGEIRARAAATIPEGNCFWYGRRFAIDVEGDGDPDAVIAATGCPVIDGSRWRGYLGQNDPERVRQTPDIRVRSGRAFRLVALTSP